MNDAGSKRDNRIRTESGRIIPYTIIGILSLVIVIGGLLILTRESGLAVTIESVSPSDEVPRTSNFTFRLSEDVAPDSILNVQLDVAAIEFDPPIPGKFQWIDNDKIRFYPNVVLAPSTEYTATVSPALSERFGYSLRGERRFEFHTPVFRVNSASISFDYSPESNKTARLFATVEFNYEVDPEEAEKELSIEYEDGGSIAYRIVTSDPSDAIVLETDFVDRRKEDRRINLVIGQGLGCIGGNIGLSQDYIKPANLPRSENLVVSSMKPVSQPPADEYIRITFNLPVRAEEARQFMTIDPAVDVRITSRHHHIDLKGEFEQGQSYDITIGKGLRAIDGSTLSSAFSSAVKILKEDIAPQVDFVGDGFYLTRSGNLNVGLSTINVDSISVEVYKVFSNNLTHLLNWENPSYPSSRYGYRGDLLAVGRMIESFDIRTDNIKNQEVVTPLAVKEYLDGDRKGIFRMTARRKTHRWTSATRWIVATDLGMVAKKSGDDLWVWVNSLSNLDPIIGADLKLLSRNNQELMSARTGSEGLAIFKGYTSYTDEFVPYLITASQGDDISFLQISRRMISISDFDVGGRQPLKSGYEAFVYNERGIYRPGETAHIAAIVRGKEASTPEAFPVRLRVKDPDAKILTEPRAILNEQGAAEFEIVIPDYMKTGKYTAELQIGEKEIIGRTTFLVEEFMPDRMKVKVSTDLDSYRTGETAKIWIEAVNLFGPPASGRNVSGEIEIETYPFQPDRWNSFAFHDNTKSFSKQDFKLAEAILDDEGFIEYPFKIPTDYDPPSALRAVISSTVLEPGGRGVTAYKGVVIHPHSSYIGLRRTKEGYAKPHTEVEHAFVVVDPGGDLRPNSKLEVSLYHVYWQSILKKVDSRRGYRYVSEKVRDLVNEFTIDSESGEGTFLVTPQEYGQNLVVVRDIETGASSSLRFYTSGWGYAPWAMDNPDRIEIDLDKKQYRAGENAEIQIRAPFTGKLLLTIENQEIQDYRIIDLDQNTATISMQITDDYKPNVYVSAHLIRSTESLERDTPVRAFGVAPIIVSAANNQLTVEFDVPDNIRPKTTLPVHFKVSGVRSRSPWLTIAAVDEGICQLTDFRTPDPFGYFFGKRRLSVETYDVYGEILPEIESSLSSTAGDVETARKRHLTPVAVRRVKPVAFWSGIVKTDNDGFGKVDFDIPQFNGTLRLMAAAFEDDRFGSGEQKVIIRQPIVLTPTFPRFIGSSDSLTIPVSVFNGTGRDGEFDVRLRVDGPVHVIDGDLKSLSLADGKEEVIYFGLSAGERMGKVKFTVMASGNGERSEAEVDVPLRPPVPFVTRSGAGSVEEGEPVTFELPSDFIENSAEFSLSMGSMPAVKLARSLQYLLRYPHGCVEQTTSKLFPLLYFDELAKLTEPELFRNNSSDYYISEGVAKLENMQQSSGAFSYWPRSTDISNWSSIYASHFLVEARRAGHMVSDRVYKLLLRALRQASNDYRDDKRWSYQTSIYACYVLALAGEPNRSSMHFVKDNALDRISEYSQYQLAGAFALSGDMTNARALLPKTATLDLPSDERETGRNFNSPVRAQAITLDILAEIDEKNPLIPQLVRSLTNAASDRGRWRTTQENAYAFLAIGKMLKNQADANYTGMVTVEGEQPREFSTNNTKFDSKNWAGSQVTIKTSGTGTCYYYWRVDGLPSGLNINEYDNDLVIRRRYLDDNGNPVKYDSFRQGDMVIAEITVKAPNQSLDNVAIVDLLPAGLEIENPRLQSRKGVDWIGKKAYKPSYMDIRDDRLIFYGDFSHGKERRFYYGLRAVTCGSFILPPIMGEAMYAPMKASVSSSGRIKVSKPTGTGD